MKRETVRSLRRKAHGFGLNAEKAAMLALMLKGYWPVQSRFTIQGGEIDLIMKRGKTLVFVEVKARSVLEDALQSLTPVKQARLLKAARLWVSRHPKAVSYTLRMDGVFIAPWRWPQHVENVFECRL